MTTQEQHHEALKALVPATEQWIGVWRRAAATAGAVDPEGTAPDDPVLASLFGELIDALAAAMEEMPGLSQMLQIAVGKDLARTTPPWPLGMLATATEEN